MKSLWRAKVATNLAQTRLKSVVTSFVRRRLADLFSEIEAMDVKVESVEIQEAEGMLLVTAKSGGGVFLADAILDLCHACQRYCEGAEGHKRRCSMKLVHEVMGT